MQISNFIPIGVFALSMVLAILFFYFTSNLPKEKRKLHMEQMISEVINVIIFIWVGKIVTNLSLFIDDPLAVLAYPSDSKAFYLAILFSSILFFIQVKRGKIQGFSLLKSFIPVFLVASFLYEFIHLIWIRNEGSLGYFILMTLLLAVFYLMYERVRTDTLLFIILASWSAGVFVLYLIHPLVTVFGYMVAPWFVWLFFTINIIILRKRDSFGRN